MAQSVKIRDLGAAVLVAAGPTVLKGISVVNTIAASQFIQLFNAGSVAAVTLGTTNPDYELQVSASSFGGRELTVDGGQFPTGLVIASTTGEKGATPSGAGVEVFVELQ